MPGILLPYSFTNVILNMLYCTFHLPKCLKEKVWFVPHRVAKLEISNKFQQGELTVTNQHNTFGKLKPATQVFSWESSINENHNNVMAMFPYT